MAEALYERVLAQLPPHELHSSWNSVLQEELSWVCHTLDEVTLALVRLGELRNAVSQLEQSSGSTGGRNASLMTTMDDAMALQQRLAIRMDQIATGMDTEFFLEKRKTRDDLVLETKMEKLCPNSQPQICTDTKVGKAMSGLEASESMSESMSDSDMEIEYEDDDSEAALKSLMESKTTECTLWLAKKEVQHAKEEMHEKTLLTGNYKSAVARVPLSARSLKPIVKRVNALSRKNRILIAQEILNALKESVIGDTDGQQQSEVISSLQLVTKWARNLEGQAHIAVLYRDYACTVKAYARSLQPSKQTNSVESLACELFDLVNQSIACRHTDNESEVSTMDTKPKDSTFPNRVAKINKKSPSKRRKEMLGLLVCFKAWVTTNMSDTKYKRLKDALPNVLRWIRDTPRKPELLCSYCLFVDALRTFAIRTLHDSNQSMVLRSAGRMVELIAKTPSCKAQYFLATIKDRAVRLLLEMEDWQDTSSSLENMEKKLDSLRNIVDHVTRGWVPHQDPTVHKCAELLKQHIKKLQPHEVMGKCSQTLADIMNDCKLPKNKTAKLKDAKNAKRKAKTSAKRKAKKLKSATQ
ncbi:Hypothetical protein PHPALM_20122 [Phytophthora palmivora]|uniref:Uncharacterized protein n=1 Tax=Phytophthora palmivora TaxID=4796 RepID=A0A2P4XFN9_9STRA|nr:Hypothetical protein PHPALM_20122 [Phytophthora palmivora]